MPCNSEYLRQTNWEAERQLAAQLLVYLLESIDQPVPADVAETARTYYAAKDYVSALCSAISGLTPAEIDRVMYDGRNPMARKLADWWEKHVTADRERELAEAKQAEDDRLAKLAEAKLTPEELAAIRRRA
jgi:hypothetical protein